MNEDERTPPEKQPRRSVRLVFEYRGDQIELLSRQRVAMVAPAPQRLTPRPNQRGLWVELRGRDDQPLYRRNVGDPIQHDIEAPADDGEQLTRVRVAESQGRFTIVVPELNGVRTVSLVGGLTTQPEPEAVDHPRELQRLDFAPWTEERD